MLLGRSLGIAWLIEKTKFSLLSIKTIISSLLLFVLLKFSSIDSLNLSRFIDVFTTATTLLFFNIGSEAISSFLLLSFPITTSERVPFFVSNTFWKYFLSEADLVIFSSVILKLAAKIFPFGFNTKIP